MTTTKRPRKKIATADVAPSDAAFFAAAEKEAKAFTAVVELRKKYAAAEAALAAARDEWWKVVDATAASAVPSAARQSARNIWLCWQYDHATRHGLPVANECPAWPR